MIGKFKIIALCTCRIQDDESHNFIAMLNEKLINIGCRLFIYNTCWVTPSGDENKDPQLSVYNLIDYSFIDAVIVQADRFYNKEVCKKIVDKALEMKLPVVSLGLEFEGCLNIKYYHQQGFIDIIEHLINVHNVNDFHMIAGIKDNKYSEERIEVFKEVLSNHNIEFNDSMISYGGFWPVPAKEIALDLIKNKKLPRAIVCANDNMAIAVIEVLKQNGYRVPEDVIVTGYDCIDAIYSCEPTITSAYIDSKISAQVIFDTVKDALEGKKKTGIVSLGSKMFINASCGCNSQEKINLTTKMNEQVSRFCQYQDDNIYLAEAAAKFQLCNNYNDFLEIINHKGIMNQMCCLLNKEYMDEKNDPRSIKNSYSNEVLVLYDSDDMLELKENGGKFNPYLAKISMFSPRINKYLEEGRSLIFSSIHYFDSTLGYVCFYFEKHIIANYLKVPQIVTTLNNGLGGLLNSRHQQHLREQLDILYKTDALTGLLNRRAFIIEYEKLIKDKQNKVLTVVMSDLDDLKSINDTYGHDEGDVAIKVVADALREVCPNALITRLGGDEMMAVIEGKTSAARIEKSFKEYLKKYNSKSNKKYDVCASIGVFNTNIKEQLKIEMLIKYSDQLMYVNKAKNKKKK